MRTIMMDVDGVLVCGRPQDGAHLFTDLEQDLGIPPEVLQREFFKPRWPAIVTGQKALGPELSEVLTVIAPTVSAEALIDYWFRNDSRIDQDVLSAIGELRAAGDRVYLATNQEHMRASYLMTDMGLEGHVDGMGTVSRPRSSTSLQRRTRALRSTASSSSTTRKTTSWLRAISDGMPCIGSRG